MTQVTMDDFFPRGLLEAHRLSSPRRERVLLIPRERTASVLCGEFRVTNIPPGCTPAAPGMLTERYADYGMVGIIIEHPSFDPVGASHERPRIVAELERIPVEPLRAD